MNLTGLHILLTYQCTYECDHCFVWGSPQQAGVFAVNDLEEVYQQTIEVGTIDTVYFEGGETFIYYPILVKAVDRAHELGFSVGIVTNGYWITSERDAREWLRPLVAAGLDRIEISSDIFHGHEPLSASSHPGLLAAKRLRLDASLITIEAPATYRDAKQGEPGSPLTGGDVMFRGRAAAMLTEGMPRQPWDSFTSCPYENLVNPGRIHLDPFGNLHLCQGLLIGNLWKTPLSQILDEYCPEEHPIAGPLLAGGPAQLSREYSLEHEPGYVDACHLCYTARMALRSRFPDLLAPDQMYGVQ
jgi:hypothetical protein